MRYEFHPYALDEYLAATAHYVNINPRLAERFVESVEEAIARILESPSRWRVLDDDVRRCLTHTFPYGILYSVEYEYVLIIALMHCSREPDYWKDRLDRT